VPHAPRQRVIVAIAGASGALYGTRILTHLRDTGRIATHLVVSRAALGGHDELGLQRGEIEEVADFANSVTDIGASIG